MRSPDPAAILTEINRIWQDAPPEEIADLIAPYFTEDVVVGAPNLARVAKGRASVAGSYGDFVRNTKILEMHVEEPQVDFCGDVAVSTMRWKMHYEFEGGQSTESGHDTYVFRLEDGRWRICWRSVAAAQEG
jgi:ketosteroid isomerase-like protein